jgi:hypothetical protein
MEIRILLRTLSISLLLVWGIVPAQAQGGRQEWRDELRGIYQTKKETPVEPAPEADALLAGAEGAAGPPAGAASEEPRKPGKLTAEERRALRRQINEVGRDIYRPVP